MKILLTAIATMLVLTSTAQLGLSNRAGKPRYQTYKAQAEINCGCDTLTINLPTTLKVIKIGDKYYDIVPHATTIEEAKPIWHTLGNTYYWNTPGNITPTFKVDTNYLR